MNFATDTTADMVSFDSEKNNTAPAGVPFPTSQQRKRHEMSMDYQVPAKGPALAYGAGASSGSPYYPYTSNGKLDAAKPLFSESSDRSGDAAGQLSSCIIELLAEIHQSSFQSDLQIGELRGMLRVTMDQNPSNGLAMLQVYREKLSNDCCNRVFHGLDLSSMIQRASRGGNAGLNTDHTASADITGSPTGYGSFSKGPQAAATGTTADDLAKYGSIGYEPYDPEDPTSGMSSLFGSRGRGPFQQRGGRGMPRLARRGGLMGGGSAGGGGSLFSLVKPLEPDSEEDDDAIMNANNPVPPDRRHLFDIRVIARSIPLDIFQVIRDLNFREPHDYAEKSVRVLMNFVARFVRSQTRNPAYNPFPLICACATYVNPQLVPHVLTDDIKEKLEGKCAHRFGVKPHEIELCLKGAIPLAVPSILKGITAYTRTSG